MVTADRRIRVIAEWKYVGCSKTGIEVVVDNLCCNRQCSCKISSQRVSDVAYATREIDDLSNRIVRPISYSCFLNELDECQKECFDQLELVYLVTNIGAIPSNLINLNLFASNQKGASNVS